jgi:hypothetical protein
MGRVARGRRTAARPARPEATLCDVLDRLLSKGVVVAGDVCITVAGVDLVYLSVRALLCSAETALRAPRTNMSAPHGAQQHA